MSQLWQRFQLEVKANGKTSVLLAGLFLFGCCLWAPMLLRALAQPKPAAAASDPAPAAAASDSSLAPSTPRDNPERFWSDLAQSLAEDPMFQPASLQSLARDPFLANEDPEPLPVLFAEVAAAPAEVEQAGDPQPRSESLSLHSTIIGRSRSAALINGKLYHLGRRIPFNGHHYVLTKIESHRVELSAGGQTIELTINRRQLKDVLDTSESFGPLE